jgi:hypothetical protein
VYPVGLLTAVLRKIAIPENRTFSRRRLAIGQEQKADG